MKKLVVALLVSGFVLSSSVVFAGEHGAAGNSSTGGPSSRIVDFAANNPEVIQKAAGTIAAIPPAQAAMDAAMEASPQANSLMQDVQAAGGYTPAN